MALIEVDYDPEPYEAPPAPVPKLVPVDYDPEPLDPPPASGLLRRGVADTALSVGQGVVGLGESAVGLANIPTLGRAGKALKDYTGYDPHATTQFLEELKTPEQQAANRAVAEAKGFGGTLSALAQNPSVIPQKVAETIPLIAGGGAVARALPAGMTALARGAIGEGALAAGSAAEQTRQQTPGGVLTPEQAALNLTSGAVTGAITRASGGLANRLGVGDIEQLVAGGKLTAAQAAKLGQKGIARRIGEGAVTEGWLEEAPQSAQEAAFQNLALGKPVGEGVPEATAMGGVLGSVIGGGVAALPQRALPTEELAAVPPGVVPPAAAPPGPVAPDWGTTAGVFPQGQPIEPGGPPPLAPEWATTQGAGPPAAPPSGPIGRALAAAPSWQTALGAGVTTTPAEDISGAYRDQEIAALLQEQEAQRGLSAAYPKQRIARRTEEAMARSRGEGLRQPETLMATRLREAQERVKYEKEAKTVEGKKATIQGQPEDTQARIAADESAGGRQADAVGGAGGVLDAAAQEGEQPLISAGAKGEKRGDLDVVEPVRTTIPVLQGVTGGTESEQVPAGRITPAAEVVYGQAEGVGKAAFLAAKGTASSYSGGKPLDDVIHSSMKGRIDDGGTAPTAELILAASKRGPASNNFPAKLARVPLDARSGTVVLIPSHFVSKKLRSTSFAYTFDGGRLIRASLRAINLPLSGPAVVPRELLTADKATVQRYIQKLPLKEGIKYASFERQSLAQAEIAPPATSPEAGLPAKERRTQVTRPGGVAKEKSGAVEPAGAAQEGVESEQQRAEGYPGGAQAVKHFDDRLNDAGMRTALTRMAESAGWQQQGGELLRDAEGKVSGRTTWIPRESWFAELPERLNEAATLEAVKKAIAGSSLGAKERRVVGYMLDAMGRGREEGAVVADEEGDREAREERAAIADTALDEISDDDTATLLSYDTLNDEDIDKFFGGPQEGDLGAEEALAEGAAGGRGAPSEEARPAEEPLLRAYRETDLKRREEARVATGRREAEETAARLSKEEADKAREGFVLSGSKREADELAARGQQSLFDQPTKRPVAKAPPPKDELKDVGEKIEGARKDLWAGRALGQQDIVGMNERELQKFVTKEHVFPRPNYQAIADHVNAEFGDRFDAAKQRFSEDVRVLDMGAGTALLIKKIRDSIANPPLGASRESLEDYLTAVAMVRKALEDLQKFIAPTGSNLVKLAFGEDIVKNERYQIWSQESPNWKYLNALGNKFARTAQVDARDWARAIIEADKTGFPAKQEVWQREYRVFPKEDIKIKKGHRYVESKPVNVFFLSAHEGRFLANFPTEAEAEMAIAAYTPYLVLAKKSGNVVKQVDTEAEGINFARDTYKAQHPTIKREDKTPKLRHIVREGPDYRGGRDIGDNEFKDAFGFRGVQFGNWTDQRDRQQSLNHAYDALMDLADALGIPPKALSLNGELGMAFGARGTGRAAAHYEPTRVVINLTKTSGAGSAAHEWAHALDDYFGRISGDLKGKKSPYVSHGVGAKTAMRPEMVQAFKDVMNVIHNRLQTNEEVLKAAQADIEKSNRYVASWLKGMRGELKDAEQHGSGFDALAAAVQNAAGDAREERDALISYIGEKNGKLPSKDRRKGLDNNLDWRRRYYERLNKALAGTATPMKLPSKYARLSTAKGPYWARAHELFARAFESFMLDKLAGQGRRSDYLVHPAKQDRQETDPDYPYPAGTERTNINAAFEKFVGAIAHKETEKGTALYSYAGERGAKTPKHALAAAREFAEQGIAMEEIRKTTGWFRGKDNLWRWELSDKDARLKLDWDAYDQTVGEALDHKVLFENYPSLAKIGLVFRFDLPANVTGGYAPAENAIHLNANLTPGGAKSTLLHELQHAVQVIEGFARGGKPTDKGFISAAAAMGIDTNDKDAMVSAYRRLLGEVEARDVQARMGLTAEDLRERPPYVSQGIPESEFIVQHEGESAANITQGQTAARLRANLAKRLGTRAIEGLERAGFEIVETEAKIPPELLTTLGWTIRGVHDRKTGKTYLVAGSIPEGTELGVLLHEVGVHAGIEGLLGTKLHRALLGNIKAILSPLELAIAEEKSEAELNAIRQRIARQSPLAKALVAARGRIPNNTRAGHVVEEVLAYTVEDNANRNLTLVKRVLGAIRAWLLRHGFRLSEIRPEDLVALARASVFAVSREATVQRGRAVAPAYAAQAPTFYSEMAKFIDAKAPGKTTAAQWKVLLDGWAKAGKFKADELEFSGVKEFLDLLQGLVTKDQVLGFIKSDGVQIEETVLAGLSPEEITDLTTLQNIAASGETLSDQERRRWEELDKKQYEDLERPKFAQWQLPGAEEGSYREVLLRLPPSDKGKPEPLTKLPAGYDPIVDSHQPPDRRWGVTPPGQVSARPMGGRHPTKEAALEEALALVNNERLASWAHERGKGLFRGGHYDESNVLVHIRFSVRIDANGKRVLFIEEIQSDWAQKGKAKGFFGPKEKAELAALRYKAGGAALTEAEDKRVLTLAAAEVVGAPVAPFVGKTEAWVGLALKRMIRYGSENGFDRIAWTTGEQQAERYDLSKQVEEISAKRNPDGTYWAMAVTKGGERAVELGSKLTESELEAAVGKDLTAKIVKQPAGEQRYSGLDLKVGGAGMRAFYDKILPNVANALLKKLGGGRVGTVELEFAGGDSGTGWRVFRPDGTMVANQSTRQNAERYMKEGYRLESPVKVQPSFDITPALRESAMRGLPLFSRVRAGEARAKFRELKERFEREMAERRAREGPRFSRAPQTETQDNPYLTGGRPNKPEMRENFLALESTAKLSPGLRDYLANAIQTSTRQKSQAGDNFLSGHKLSEFLSGILPHLGPRYEAEAQMVRNLLPYIDPQTIAGFTSIDIFSHGVYKQDVDAVNARFGDRRDPVELILHETIHAVTARAVSEGLGDGVFSPSGDPVLRQAGADLAELYRFAKGRTQGGDYGLHNEYEFIAEALSNPEFQRRLTKIKLSPKLIQRFGEKPNLWSAFLDSLRRILKIGARDKGAQGVLDAVIKAAAPLLDADKRLREMGVRPLLAKEFLAPQAPLYSRATAATATLPGLLDNGNVPPPSPFNEENRRLREEDKTHWNRAKTFWRRNFTPGGLLPAAVFEQKNVRDGELGVIELDTENLVAQLDHAVKAVYGKRMEELAPAERQGLQRALTGKVDENIDPRVRTVINAMRQHVDRLSGEYIAILERQIADMTQSGDPTAEARAGLLRTITGNLGRYVHRSYRAFDDPQWFSKLPNEVIDAARDYLRGRYIDGGMDPAEAADKAERALHTIVKTGTAYDSLESFIREGKLGAKDLSILQKRKDIAPEIRALLGEYDDPRLNYAKSTSKMARLVWNTRFLDRVREIGMGTFLFEEADAPPGATTKIAADASEVHAPLNGLWTFPEIDQAFKDAIGKEKMADWYRLIVQMNGAVKYGKVILSPTTQIRNFMSAAFFALANGHFDMRHIAKSVDTLRGKSPEYASQLVRLGIMDNGAYAGEMMQLIRDSKIEEILRDKKSTPYRVWRDLNAFAKKAYRNGDDFWKIVGFENEKAALMDVGIPKAQAERDAAERIRNTYPTYSMVGRGIKWLARFPLAGTFVSFPAEIIRTTTHMLRYVAEDYQDPQRRPIALRRAVGLAMVSGFAYALQVMTMAMMGMDDDEEEAVRRLAAPWQRNSNFLFTRRDERGQLRYFDLSFLDPYNWFKRPITALLRDQPWEDKATGALRDMLSPFLGTDIAAGALFEVLSNKKESGGPVFNEFADPVNQSVAIADHLRKALQPGFVGNLERTYRAAKGDYTPSGKRYDLADEGMGWIGWRATTLDPKTALYYRSFEFTDAKKAATSTLNKTLATPNEVSREAIASAKASAQRQLSAGFKDMSLIVDAAMKNGMTRPEVIRVLRTSGVSLRDIPVLLSGREPKLMVSPQQIRNATTKARAIYGPEKATEIRRRYLEAGRTVTP